ncbi:MAG: ATP synthase F1 subunit delta [Deltaproteobacteria bacterium]|jgi:F-type H+-transporting ATPase subunit delta|nr:ATP synthase F1 subunit delta [Deltaproteobacteria bacterium]
MDVILAKRYAQAFLTLGIEDGEYARRGEELQSFAEALAGTPPEELAVLWSPVYPGEIRGRILGAILAKAALSPLLNSFVMVLFERGRLKLLPEVAAAYGALVDEKEGLSRGTVTTATPLPERDLESIREALSLYLGRKVVLSQNVDGAIMGGIVAKIGDLVLDGSVRSRLLKLKAAFAQL